MDELLHWFGEERGRRQELATMLGITLSAVSQWSQVPIQHANRIAERTGIPRERLRPDIYGPVEPAQ